MKASDKLHFQLLKEAVAEVFLQDNKAPKRISAWKGDEIVAFQEDLARSTRGRVSEKWFYTYFKNEPEKLPRIDMLNLLSEYAEYKNWNDFKAAHPEATALTEIESTRRNYLWMLIPLVLLLVAYYFYADQENEFRFCMIDEDSNEAVTDTRVNVKVLLEGQSPVYLKTDESGCFNYSSTEESIRFVLQSPYYKTDTIYRTIDSETNSIIKLATDDYALMLRYYSNGNVDEINKRRAQLDKLIAENAQIYQVYPGQVGIELYSKEEFINKLTIPTGSLKNISVLQKEYENGLIKKLKFTIR